MTTTRPDAEALNRWFSDHLQESRSVPRATRGIGGSGGGSGGDAGSAAGAANGRASFRTEDFQQPDAVLTVHFADGSVFHTTPQEWLDRVSAADPTAPTRGLGKDGQTTTVELPFELRPRLAPLTRAAGGSASDGAALIERYTLARLTEPSTLDRVYNMGAWAADRVDDLLDHVSGAKLTGVAAATGGMVGAKLCFAFETSQLNAAVGAQSGALLYFPPRPGSYGNSGTSGTSGSGASLPTWSPWPSGGDAPVGWPDGNEFVLFLHGTASSTLGSFGSLSVAEEASGKRRLPDDFAGLRERCGLLGWDHRSLSASPVKNALDAATALAAMLPRGRRCTWYRTRAAAWSATC
ncbi:hypothetical protein [Roseateles chitinivorans]|uniref:hypothetical protein n=1 Tax=Roseateles chitinivorans TaxID=2917965 RepID=UPI003D6703C4